MAPSKSSFSPPPRDMSATAELPDIRDGCAIHADSGRLSASSASLLASKEYGSRIKGRSMSRMLSLSFVLIIANNRDKCHCHRITGRSREKTDLHGQQNFHSDKSTRNTDPSPDTAFVIHKMPNIFGMSARFTGPARERHCCITAGLSADLCERPRAMTKLRRMARIAESGVGSDTRVIPDIMTLRRLACPTNP